VIWHLRNEDLCATTFSRELVGDDYGGIPACAILVDAAPGQGPGLHKHPYAELFFVVDGEATFTDGTQEHLVRGGEIVIVGPDQPHGFVNSGSGRLRQIDIHLSPRFNTEWLEASTARPDAVARANRASSSDSTPPPHG
jgi:mannose-6-phosphate isomerase-like protein (cupin superfamily)